MSADRRGWYARAQVRRQPPPPADDGGARYDPALLPWAEGLGEPARQALQARALTRYLRATVLLECKIIQPVLFSLAEGEAPLRLARPLRLEARRLAVDEAFHALQAHELLDLLGLDAALPPEPPMLTRLNHLVAAQVEEADQGLLRFFFAVVSETLVSRSLTTLASSAVIAAPVRAFVASHARDEATHGAWFGRALTAVWAGMDPGQQAQLGPLFPALLQAYLAVDTEAVRADLAAVGLAPEAAEAALARALAPEAAALRAAAAPTLRALRGAGVLAHAPARAALARAGLLDGEA